MKVLIVAGLFYPSKLGGPSKALYWLAKALISMGLDVSVVTSNNYIDAGLLEFNKWIKTDNIRIRYCTSKTKLPFKVILHSVKELRKCKTVILSSVFYLPVVFVAFFSLITKKKVIWSPRGELFDSALKNNKLKLLYLKVLKRLFVQSTVFHATSFDEQRCIKKHFGGNAEVVIIPNYFVLPEQQKRKKQQEEYLLFVGRIAPIKALDKLLNGLYESKLFMQSDFRLFIVGDSQIQFVEYEEKLKQILSHNENLKKKVVFLGNVDGIKKNKLFANAYFSFLVSHSENFGNVVLEALAQGTPVVASKGTPWQILAEREAGFWIDNSEKEIASCIDKLLLINEKKYLKMRNNASNLAKEFCIYLNIEKWLKVIVSKEKAQKYNGERMMIIKNRIIKPLSENNYNWR